jgi:hypothetical protein
MAFFRARAAFSGLWKCRSKREGEIKDQAGKYDLSEYYSILGEASAERLAELEEYALL